ncbi:MAG: sigma-54 dependent transcriptional regulator [Candidatus Latescibacterota bacterium]
MAARDNRFLLLTQDPRLVDACTVALQDQPVEVVPVREAGALPALLGRRVDGVFVDLNLPDLTLQAAADELAQRRELPTIILSQGSTGVWDRISRGSPLEKVVAVPIDTDELTSAVDGLLERSRFLHERLVGTSSAMQEIREQILLVGPTPMTVLITGESGTGKDVVARALHHYSGRDGAPFLPINCAAIPENLLENELFGHEKGAFTDARAQTRGIFEQADGGTVFLDEIGEMALSAQVRLLRVLEERRVTRIGGEGSMAVDVRVLAASNKDLLTAVSRGEFRRDLYYRLKVVELPLPPLRERRQDIPQLLQHYIDLLTHNRRGARFEGVSAEAMDLLQQYDWPGNVRELRNLVEHFVFLGPRGPVGPQDVIPHLDSPPTAGRHLPMATHKTPDQSERELIYFALLDLKREVAELRRLFEDRDVDSTKPLARPIYTMDDETEVAPASDTRWAGDGNGSTTSLKDLERDAIVRALETVAHNRRKAAELLGIGERTLYRKIDEYGLK